MQKNLIILAGMFLLLPELVFATASKEQITSNSHSTTSDSATITSSTDISPTSATTGVSTGSTGSTDSTGSTGSADNNTPDSTSSSSVRSVNSSSQSSANQINNSANDITTQKQGTGALITEGKAVDQQELFNSQPKYSPNNSQGMVHRSIVANAVQVMLQVANQTENPGIGQQIKSIAQTQSQNQDRIAQAVDKAETRTSFAKFFIGANYKELKTAKEALDQNKSQIQTLTQLMASLTSDTEKLQIANQVIALQSEQYAIHQQISELSSGFSLFGWMARWKNHFSI